MLDLAFHSKDYIIFLGLFKLNITEILTQTDSNNKLFIQIKSKGLLIHGC